MSREIPPVSFVKNGPKIPASVLDAAEEGTLALFCGAGVSCRAGLPTFEGLVHQAYRRLDVAPTTEEEKAIESSEYGRALGLLEDRLQESLVRRSVIELLTLRDDADLVTHRSLLDLSKTDDGAYRLITTNFDRGFIQGGLGIDSAPRVGSPHPLRWRNPVHLHGLIRTDDPNGNELILTSADFGRAYLTEGWAARFVSELFRRFTVLFIGYSIGDPVLRYVLDAYAADRVKGDKLPEVYALVGVKSEPQNNLESWRTKNVHPIPYSIDNDHYLLHATLSRWATFKKDGLPGKHGIIRQFADAKPTHTDEESLFLWTISTKDGKCARHFSSINPLPPLEWLEVFEGCGLIQREVSEVGETTQLVSSWSTYSPRSELTQVALQLGSWLARHVGDQRLLEWVISKGGSLHTQFHWLVEMGLEREEVASPRLIDYWRLVCSEKFLHGDATVLIAAHIDQRLRRGEWNPILRSDLLGILSPTVWTDLNRSFVWNKRENQMEGLPWLEVELRAGQNSAYLIEQIMKSNHSERILEEIALPLIHLLRESIDLESISFGHDYFRDNSISAIRSIETGTELRPASWSSLVDLIRESYLVLKRKDPAEARTLVRIWEFQKYPVFRRLSYFARLDSDLFPIDESLCYLLSDQSWWLWSGQLECERYRLLQTMTPLLTESQTARLLESVMEGPPRDRYREDMPDEEWERVRDHMQFHLLGNLHGWGARLDESSAQRFKELQALNPLWTLQSPLQADTPEFEWGNTSDYSVQKLLDVEREELRSILLTHHNNRNGLMKEWEKAVVHYPPRGITILLSLVHSGDFDKEVFTHTVDGLRDGSYKRPSIRIVQSFVASLSEDHVDLIADSLCWWLLEAAKEAIIRDEVAFLSLWDALSSHTASKKDHQGSVGLGAALNSRAGRLASAIIYRIRHRRIEKKSELPEEYRTRLDRLILDDTRVGFLARVMLASSTQFLFQVDPGWIKDRILSRFDWSHSEEAIEMWRALLLPRKLAKEIIPFLSHSLLQTMARLREFGNQSDILCAVFVSVCVDQCETWTSVQMRDTIRNLDKDGLAGIARAVSQKLRRSGDGAAAFWATRVEPWFRLVWSKEKSSRDPKVSYYLARAALATDSSFPQAVESIVGHLVPISDAMFFLNDIRETDLARRFPESFLRLMERVISKQSYLDATLRGCLSQAVVANPNLMESKEYKRLNDLLIERRL